MTLHAVVGAHHQNRVIECAQRALRLGGKVNMSRSIDQHEMRIGIVKHRLSRENRDSAFALDCIGVQMGVAVVHATAPANFSGFEEHGLGKRRFSGIDVRQNPHNRLLRHVLVRLLQHGPLQQWFNPPHCPTCRGTMRQPVGEPVVETRCSSSSCPSHNVFRRFAPCGSRTPSMQSGLRMNGSL